MTIRIDEASLLRAGFPRDLVAALRDLATLSASSVTPADLTALQVQITANDAELAEFEKQILIRPRQPDHQKFAELEALIMSARRPVTALPVATVAGGSGNAMIVAVDFGASFTDKAQTVVTGEAWVTAASSINAQVRTTAGADPDEMRLLNLQPVVSDIVPGDGFTLTLYSEPEARGVYNVMVSGV